MGVFLLFFSCGESLCFSVLIMPEWEDGKETGSDFLARMLLMGKIEIDEENQTMVTVNKTEEDKNISSSEEIEDKSPRSYDELLRQNDEMRLTIAALEEEKTESNKLLEKFINTIGNMNQEITKLRAQLDAK